MGTQYPWAPRLAGNCDKGWAKTVFWSTPLFDRIMQRKSVEDLTLSVSSLLSKKCQRPRATESRPWSNAHFSGRFLATVPFFAESYKKAPIHERTASTEELMSHQPNSDVTVGWHSINGLTLKIKTCKAQLAASPINGTIRGKSYSNRVLY